MNVKHEQSKLKANFEANERKMKDKLEEDVKYMKENLQRQLEREIENIQNMVDIEVQKLRTETEEKIAKLNKDRYNDLMEGEKKKTPTDKKTTDASDRLKKQKDKILAELARDDEAYEEQAKARRARFEQQMNMIYNAKRDIHLLDFLKKNVVELVTAQGPIKIADEVVLESRNKITINRNAIVSGQSWALYKCTMDRKPVLGLFVALKCLAMDQRREYEKAAKAIRFLCGREQVMHQSLVKVYDIFTTDHKRYTFMEEFPDYNLDRMFKYTKGFIQQENIMKWSKQMAELFTFLHKYAIAHMNIRADSFIFDNDKNIKVVGLSRLYPYFNLDQEKILRHPKILPVIYNAHLPPECFEDEFRPELADVWSYGLIFYEFYARKRPEIVKAMQKGNKIKVKISYDNINLGKVKSTFARNLISRCCNLISVTRPHFEDILKMDYFTKTEVETPANSPADATTSPTVSPSAISQKEGVEVKPSQALEKEAE